MLAGHKDFDVGDPLYFTGVDQVKLKKTTLLVASEVAFQEMQV